jgi:hypothetical protein
LGSQSVSYSNLVLLKYHKSVKAVTGEGINSNLMGAGALLLTSHSTRKVEPFSSSRRSQNFLQGYMWS